MDGGVAIVTGAGQGIGEAIAKRLVVEGYAVVIAEQNYQSALQVAREIAKAGGRASAYQTDVSDEESVKSVVQFTKDTYGRIDALVNNAGIHPKSLVINMSKQEWDTVIAVILKGTYLFCKHVLPEMVSRRSGKIVNITSDQAFRGSSAFSHYSAAKAGVTALTKSIALEVASVGIQVNAIAPGLTDTLMPRRHSSEEEMKAKASAVPMGRLAKPDEIAETVAYLLSSCNTFITGQTICVSGGKLMLG
jgi:NAD(P)-dependent dehydrogenase (short-subunit alcohol dehydrogenase family)